jgi:hypothetical protein
MPSGRTPERLPTRVRAGSFPTDAVTPRRCLPVMIPLLAAALAPACKAKAPAITEPFTDDFERAEVGPAWNNTGADYRVADGKLSVAGAHNHPLWLRRRLPRNVVVELDVMSKSPDGDIKVELFGDGESFDPDKGQYFPTGYVFVFGGWHNSLSIIGKKGEHDDGVKVRRPEPHVVPNQVYHFTITRKDGQLEWRIDQRPFLTWRDPEPLAGEQQEYFGVGNWEADVTFDNVRIAPLP